MTENVMPVLYAAGAEARLAELGMHTELLQMAEWVRHNVAGLQGIRVTLGLPYAHLGGKPGLVIRAHRDWPTGEIPTPPPEIEWAIWKAQTFPPRVCNHFIMAATYQPLPASSSA